MERNTERALQATADNFRQFSRNGRWGTCADCPREHNDRRRAYPEFCVHTKRYDHLLTVDDLCENYKVQFPRKED
jgi:hypothetical protein